jgi:hypothetical protein
MNGGSAGSEPTDRDRQSRQASTSELRRSTRKVVAAYDFTASVLVFVLRLHVDRPLLIAMARR